MTGYGLINLKEMIKQLGEDKVKTILSNFSCPINKDVENFIKAPSKAIEFAKQGIAATHLVITSYKTKPVIIGYFSLANKYFSIDLDSMPKSLRRRLNKFAQWDFETKRYYITAPLLAQLGKNFNDEYNQLITGDELLKIACDKIHDIQLDLGGKVIYVECEDNEKLMQFYQSNGFYFFHKRTLDKHEQLGSEELELMQLLRYENG